MIVLDTDYLTLLERRGPSAALILHALEQQNEEMCTTTVNYEEQVRGWLARIANAKSLSELVECYGKLNRQIESYRNVRVLAFDERAAVEYQAARKSKPRVKTMDLRIASIVLANKARLYSRNLSDFQRVPGLVVEDILKGIE
jgi:tRNA(fMet)-specific endonuclease VapC